MSTATLPSAAYDNKIYAKFSKKNLEKKKINKNKFQGEFDLIEKEKMMLVSITTPLTEKNGFDVFLKILPGLENLNLQIALLGVGTEKFQKPILNFSKKNPGKVAILEESDENLRKLHAAADVEIFLTKNAATENEIKNALAYGSVPIATDNFSKFCKNYNPNLETGNAFLFDENNFFSFFAALVRAAEHFRFPYDWKTICRNAIDTKI